MSAYKQDGHAEGRERRPKFIDTEASLLVGSELLPASSSTDLSPAPTAMADGLAAVGLREFFDLEGYPIVVYDIHETALVYANQSFSNFKHSNPQSGTFSQPSFLPWLLEARDRSEHLLGICGRSWTLRVFSKRWLILSSHHLDDDPATSRGAPPPTPPAFTLRHRSPSPMLQGTEPAPKAMGQDSPSIPSVSAMSPAIDASPSQSQSQQQPQRALDWTRYNVPNLTAHCSMIKTFPWHQTSVGAIDTWPEALRTSVVALAANPEPRVLLWGPDHVMIYNEACSPLFGQKHPQSMGARGEDVWSEAWAPLAGFISRAETEGKATRMAGIPLTMHRHGFDEETFWITSFMPVTSKGRVVGVLDEFTEITNTVIQERRRDNLIRLSENFSRIDTLDDLWNTFLEGMEQATEDIPYCAVYTPTDSSHSNPKGLNTPSASPHRFSLRGAVGIDPAASTLPRSFDLNANEQHHHEFIKVCRDSWRTATATMLQTETGTLPEALALSVGARGGGVAVKTVCLVPVLDLIGHNQLAFVVIALTARRPHDSSATALVGSISDLLTRAASTIYLPLEQRRTRQRFEEIETSLSQQLQTANLEAEKKEARYERLFATAPVGMYAITTDERLLYFNDAYLSHTGSTRDLAESDQAPAKQLIHDEDYEVAMKQWHVCIRDKVPIQVEYRTKHEWRSVDPATGEEMVGDSWVITAAIPELDEQGNINHIMGWILDISERKYHESLRHKQFEEEQAEARFARLASEAPMGMYLIRPDGQPIYLNSAYYEILGLTKDEFQAAQKRGLGWSEQIVEEDRHLVDAAWQRLSKAGTPINIEYRVKKEWKTIDPNTGTELTGPTWLQSSAFAEKSSAGDVLHVQGFVTDISEKKFSERLLAERLEEALETKRQADRFIDMTSHELRNPLSAILQSADGILSAVGPDDGPGPGPNPVGREGAASPVMRVYETVVEAAHTIILCAQHQKRIVDDILTLSKLDSNLLVISPDVTSLPTLIEKSFKMFDPELERTEMRAVLEIEQGYRELKIGMVMLDSSRVLQVVINFLTNAIKFTRNCKERDIKIFLNASRERPQKSNQHGHFIEPRPGRPDLARGPEWGTGEELYVQIAVRDSGRGLNDEELKLLFHRFQQASPKTYKQYGGSGLGLFISRELTELQGGQIGVSSEAGKGSTFTFYVKARRVADAGGGIGGGKTLDPKPLPPPEEATAVKCTPFSCTLSHQCGTAARIVTAATTARTTTAKIATAKTMTAKTTTAKTLMTTTTRSKPQASAAARAASSPVVPTLSTFGPQPARSSSSSAATEAPPVPGQMHVLVVEDNEINQRVMATQLRRLGCKVHVAGHGLEALDFLRRTTLWNPFLEGFAAVASPVQLSVILMDLEMPVLGGLGCVRRIREMQREGQLLSHVPVIAVTANARSEQIASAIEAGMDSVVTKPFRIPELVPQMEALVKRLKGEDGGGL